MIKLFASGKGLYKNNLHKNKTINSIINLFSEKESLQEICYKIETVKGNADQYTRLHYNRAI